MAERLARFSASTVDDPRMFGGGAASAQVCSRSETVAYGYLAVAEEFADPDSGSTWCTLTVTLPTAVPAGFTVDHRTVLGQPGVPAAGTDLGAFGDALFDRSYAVVGDEGAAALIGPSLRAAVLQRPAQRLSLTGSTLLLRTFDGVRATDEVVEWLEELAGEVLAATPAFVTSLGQTGTFPPGLYGRNGHSSGTSRAHRLTDLLRRRR